MELVDQPEYGTNQPYLIDFIQVNLGTKLLDNDQIKALFLSEGQSAAQIAKMFGVAKSVIFARLAASGGKLESSKGRLTNPDNYRLRNAPYGHSVSGGKLVLNKTELRVCRLVTHAIGVEGKSLSDTARELARRGFKNRSGTTCWDHSTVRNIYNRWKGKL